MARSISVSALPDRDLVDFFEPLSKAGFRIEESLALFLHQEYFANQPERTKESAQRVILHRDRIVRLLGARLLAEAAK